MYDVRLARISALTTGQLIEQIKQMALAIDQSWAQRRYEQAVAQRKMVGYRTRTARRTCLGTTCRRSGRGCLRTHRRTGQGRETRR